MGFLDRFRKKETKAEAEESRTLTEEYFMDILTGTEMTEEKAMQIPAVSACVEYIGNKVALSPAELFKKTENGLEKAEDYRVRIMNDEPSEFFDSILFRKMLVKDYLLHGVCYAYKKMAGNRIEELIFIPQRKVQKTWSEDALNRKVRYWIDGVEVPEYQLFRLLRRSEDGINGKGILHENKEELAVAYAQIEFTKDFLDRGGRKAGYLTVEDKITKEALEDLKEKWPSVYNGKKGATMAINAGAKFNELSGSPQEMQIIENKRFDSERICNLFGLSPSILDGSATEEQDINAFETAVLPIIRAFEKGCNKYLLLEREKGDIFFCFDVDAVLMGTMEKRFKVYKIGKEGGWMQVDEIRERENMKKLGLNFITMGLQDVLFDPETKEIFIPNMAARMKAEKGGGVKINED